MPPSIQVSSIPTLSNLYKIRRLSPAAEAAEFPPSPTLNSKISFVRTSITTLATTCIVNAANESLLGGGGVDGAIHAAAGPALLAECRTLNGCATGSAKITSAYELPSSYVIHAVGPIYARAKRQRPGLEAELLESCYATSLELAAAKGGSVAFSCLSTGVYGYPSGEAAEVICRVVRSWLEEREGKENGEQGKAGLERIVFCCFERKDEVAYEKWLPKIFPPSPEDLPTPPPERKKEPEDEVEGSGVIVSKDESDEPQTKKAKTESQETTRDDWEAVEKPEAASLEQSADMSEEGEKVETTELAESDGEKIEKPKEEVVKTSAGYEIIDGAKEEENRLGKDW